MTSQTDSRLGQAAQELMNNPAYQDAFKRLTERYCHSWMVEQDQVKRELLHARVQVLQGVLDDLHELITFNAGDGDDDY
jgi:hypothetical protein